MNEMPRKPSEGEYIQIKKIGNSLGLILSKELLARLKLKEGDKLHIIEQTGRQPEAFAVRPEARQSDGDRARIMHVSYAIRLQGA